MMKENDIVRKAEYLDIILSLLSKPYNITSITKLIFFSFSIKHMYVFNSKKYNFIEEFFSNISVNFFLYYMELEDIFWIINLLNMTKLVNIDNDNIYFTHKINYVSKNKLLINLLKRQINPIKEINKLDPKSVIEEVVRYV